MKRVFFSIRGSMNQCYTAVFLNQYCYEHPGVSVESVQFAPCGEHGCDPVLMAAGVLLVPDDLITPWEPYLNKKADCESTSVHTNR